VLGRIHKNALERGCIVNPYDHYQFRLEHRKNNIHPASSRIERALKTWFDEYRAKDAAVIGMIHGDPVLSNVIMTTEGAGFKFIDMRGMLGDTLSIWGDVMYDYAKIYQSLLGYDEIMHQKYVSITSKSMMQQALLDHIASCYGEAYVTAVQVIAYSHIYTLLPLHSSCKAQQYATLIDVTHLEELVQP
jgi:hypothetical protein